MGLRDFNTIMVTAEPMPGDVTPVVAGGLDMLAAGRDIGVGTAIKLEIDIVTTLVGAGTVLVELITATDLALTAGVVVLQPLVTIPTLSAAGTRWTFVLAESNMLRFIGLRLTASAATITDGAMDARIFIN